TTRTVPLEPEPVLQFVKPSSQQLMAFRKLIEENDVGKVREIIETNPRYLINKVNRPTILKEGPRYNALHIVAIEGREQICNLILQTVSKPAYMALLHGEPSPADAEATAMLLDMYLNTPDKSSNETPLHFAAKYGSVGVVMELMAYAECKLQRNPQGMLPGDMICSRAKAVNNTPEIRQAIRELLEVGFYVPVLRSDGDSVPPIVGEPFTIANPSKLEPEDVTNSRRTIKAYAGPMSRDDAISFFKRWSAPPRLIAQCEPKKESPWSSTILHRKSKKLGKSALNIGAHERNVDLLAEQFERLSIEEAPETSDESSYFNVSFMCDETKEEYELSNVHESPLCRERTIRLDDIAKGLETIGRALALQRNVGWQEHWEFLGAFCNLASAEGLQTLDAYLAERSSEQRKKSEKSSKQVNTTINTEAKTDLEADKASTITKDERSNVSNWYLRPLKSLQVLAITVSKYFTAPSQECVEDEEDEYYSCTDSDDDSVNDSILARQDAFINSGSTPGNDDYNVWKALQHENIDELRHPHVFQWQKAMSSFTVRNEK
ncbi:ankyrin repeat and LEM domain-containing protein 2-like, partial [Anopheles cruzii]|uniref:ankyrin repeat and LEM domain-containing protein 2-like n=1 Tax=Anopheles cruzii TaxID=68878 RepID=UPI0022EC2809